MKAFICDAGEMRIEVDRVEGYVIREIDRAICIIFAESRGQARSIMAQKYHLDFTDNMAIRQLPGDHDRPIGIFDYPDPLGDGLWYQAALIMGAEEETCPVCKGEKYIRQLIGYSYGTAVRDYELCETCAGRGIVAVSKGKLF